MTFHIERRVDNKGETHFRASTRVKGTDGELHRVRTSWRDLQREAKDDGEQLLEELAKPVRGDETVAALLERFMRDYCVPPQVAPTTRLNYRLAIDHHITGVWLRADSEPVQMGEIRAADLLAADVAEWQALQLTSGKSDGTGLGPKTVRGIRGVVTDGAVRDTPQIAKLGFPVFSRGISIKGTTKRQKGELNKPIVIAGALVHPGDFVIGDADGVVIVPAAEVDAAIAKAHEIQKREAGIMAKLKQGDLTLDLLNFRPAMKDLGLDQS